MLTAKALFEKLDQLFIQCDPAYNITHTNRFVKRLSATNGQELIGKNLVDFFHLDDHLEVCSLLEDTKNHSSKRYTHRWKLKNNSYIWCRWTLIRDDESNTIFFLADDISEYKRVKSALLALEKVTDTGYWEIDLDTHYLFWSENVHKIHETDPLTYTPKLEDGIKFYHPDSIPALEEGLKELHETGRSYSKDLKFITSKGKDLIVNTTAFSETQNGRVVRSFGTFKDLTKQKEDDILRQRLEQRIVLALKAAKIGVWELDIVHDELTWDDRVFEIHGKTAANFTGKIADWKSTLHPEDAKSAQQAFLRAVEKHIHFDHKYRVITENKELRHVHGLASFIYDQNNNPIKATGINIDLTEAENIKKNLIETSKQAQLNAQLAQKLAEKAKAADQQKSVFLANMSHEIRTPISGILGLTDILLSNETSDALNKSMRKEYLQLIKHSSDHLLKIITDILDFSKIEAGKINIEYQPFDFNDLTINLVEDFKRRAKEKNIEFVYKSNTLPNVTLISDPFRLKQILYNLLGNAIKFSNSGCIELKVRLLEQQSGHGQLIIDVSDTGIGIAKDKQSLLFKPFVQIDSGAARTSQGTGLGLSITHKLVDLLNGNIYVRSELGSGSTFTVEIPVELSRNSLNEKTEQQPLIDSNEAAFLKNLSALVAEDNDINQVVIQTLLSQLGISSTAAENGEEALALLRNQSNKTFDLILMDCQMPRLDGYSTTKIIRSEPSYEMLNKIPIIALTANAMVGDKEKCLAAGMDDYLAKPVDLAGLRKAILRVMNFSAQHK